MPYMNSDNADRLVNDHADMILRISYMYLKDMHDAEDICQEVFLKLLSKDIRFETPSHERAWIIRAAINACRDQQRKRFRIRNVSMDEAVDVPAPEVPDSELLDLVLALPENYRLSIYLHYYEGYQVNEIAQILMKPPNTISSYLTRGRKKLKRALQRSKGQEGSLEGGTRYVL